MSPKIIKKPLAVTFVILLSSGTLSSCYTSKIAFYYFFLSSTYLNFFQPNIVLIVYCIKIQVRTFNGLLSVPWNTHNLCIRLYIFATYNLQAARNGIPIFPWILLIRTIWPVLLEIMLGRMAEKKKRKLIKERAT